MNLSNLTREQLEEIVKMQKIFIQLAEDLLFEACKPANGELFGKFVDEKFRMVIKIDGMIEEASPKQGHNHVTRDIKPIGQCPACDRYHDKYIESIIEEAEGE